MLKTYTRKQNIIVLIIILGVLVLTSLPYIVGILINSNDYFLGGNHLNQTDLYVYISHIEQIKDGKILVANLFTSEKQTPVFFTPLWLVLGFIAKIFNLNVLLVFQLARILIGLIFLYFLFYYFLVLFFK